MQLLEDFSVLSLAIMKKHKKKPVDIFTLQYELEYDIVNGLGGHKEFGGLYGLASTFIRKHNIGFHEWDEILAKDIHPLVMALHQK